MNERDRFEIMTLTSYLNCQVNAVPTMTRFITRANADAIPEMEVEAIVRTLEQIETAVYQLNRLVFAPIQEEPKKKFKFFRKK